MYFLSCKWKTYAGVFLDRGRQARGLWLRLEEIGIVLDFLFVLHAVYGGTQR
jgi:hypothetical protein